MNIRRLSLCALCLVVLPFSAAIAADEGKDTKKNAEIQALLEVSEHKAWDAYKAKDASAFKPIWDVGYTGIEPSGILTLEQTLTAMKDYDIKDYTLSDFRMNVVDGDVVLLTYRATINGTYKGAPMPATPIIATTLYKKHGSTWTGVFHQETPMQP